MQKLLAEAQKLQQAQDQAGALAKLREAEALPNRNADDNYMINMMKINAGIGLKDNAIMAEAIQGALASGRVDPAEQPKFLRNLGALAVQGNDLPKALGYFNQVLALTPGDYELMIQVAELQRRAGQNRESVQSFLKAIDVAQKAGQAPNEAWYRRALAIAYDSKLPAETTLASEALVTAFPKPVNWRDALVIFRESQRLDDQTNLDVLRLIRAANGLAGERDFVEYAETASLRGLPGRPRRCSMAASPAACSRRASPRSRN